MKNLIRTFIILTLLVSVYFVNNAKAEEQNGMYGASLPALCGPTETVRQIIEEKGLVVFSISNGRTGGKPDGDVVYMVTQWVDPLGDSQMVTVTGLSGAETCIYYISFDTVINENFGGLKL